MSYILDALRRAQAERGRGGVPGLHTPAVAASSAAEVPQSSGGNRLVWLIAAGAGAIWSTDTIAHPTNAVSVAPLIAQALAALLR